MKRFSFVPEWSRETFGHSVCETSSPLASHHTRAGLAVPSTQHFASMWPCLLSQILTRVALAAMHGSVEVTAAEASHSFDVRGLDY